MAIRWDKMTVKSQEAMQTAGDLASQNGNPELLPMHLLAALLQDKEGIIAPLVAKVGVAPEKLLSEVNAEIEKLPKVSGGGAAQPHLSAGLSQALDQAFKEAANFKD